MDRLIRNRLSALGVACKSETINILEDEHVFVKNAQNCIYCIGKIKSVEDYIEITLTNSNMFKYLAFDSSSNNIYIDKKDPKLIGIIKQLIINEHRELLCMAESVVNIKRYVDVDFKHYVYSKNGSSFSLKRQEDESVSFFILRFICAINAVIELKSLQEYMMRNLRIMGELHGIIEAEVKGTFEDYCDNLVKFILKKYCNFDTNNMLDYGIKQLSVICYLLRTIVMPSQSDYLSLVCKVVYGALCGMNIIEDLKESHGFFYYTNDIRGEKDSSGGMMIRKDKDNNKDQFKMQIFNYLLTHLSDDDLTRMLEKPDYNYSVS